MLFISRTKGREVTIAFSRMTDADLLALRGQTIRIVVDDIRQQFDGVTGELYGRSVKLGIDAPSAVQIERPDMNRTTPNPRRQALR